MSDIAKAAGVIIALIILMTLLIIVEVKL